MWAGPGGCGQTVNAWGGAREEWLAPAQAERWVARVEKAAVAIHLLGLVFSLSELVAMLHVHLWRFIKHGKGQRTDSSAVLPFCWAEAFIVPSFQVAGSSSSLPTFSCLSQDTSSTRVYFLVSSLL